jgi:hypothetical protein
VIKDKLQQFKGQRIIDCAAKINSICQASGYSVVVQDPVFNTSNIDKDDQRLNVMTDHDGKITSFYVG